MKSSQSDTEDGQTVGRLEHLDNDLPLQQNRVTVSLVPENCKACRTTIRAQISPGELEKDA